MKPGAFKLSELMKCVKKGEKYIPIPTLPLKKKVKKRKKVKYNHEKNYVRSNDWRKHQLKHGGNCDVVHHYSSCEVEEVDLPSWVIKKIREISPGNADYEDIITYYKFLLEERGYGKK